MEGCPHCRLVREALTELDLDAAIYPCPKGGDRFRNRAVELGGRERFPLLVDPGEGEVLQQTSRIVAYLWRQYGDAEGPGLTSETDCQDPLGNGECHPHRGWSLCETGSAARTAS